MSTSPLRPVHLSCEYLTNPVGLDAAAPRLSWQLAGAGRGRRQSACRVLVASSWDDLAAQRGDLWDTRKRQSGQSIQLPYAGKPLASRQRCFWKVRVWDEAGKPGPWSEPAAWEMGLLQDADWGAQWLATEIAANPDALLTTPASPLFRKRFQVTKPVRQARAYVCGLGYFELTLNGRKAGDNVLEPLFTKYDVRALYVTHDVTELLLPGENAIGVMLGNGWYNCHTQEVWSFAHASWRDKEKLLLQLEVDYTDGTREVIASDASWRAAAGPVLFDGLRNGEFYDARRERTGWNLPGYHDSDWRPATVIPGPGGRLAAQVLPIRVMQTLTPVAVAEVKPGVFVFDMGQNMTGWAQVRASGPKGTEITLRYAERLKHDGDIDQEHIGIFIKSGECQTDRYTLKGEGTEVWEPRFTYHGFRWVQVSGFPGTPTLDSLRGRVVHSAFAATGSFACSNELLNDIQACTRWSYIGNFVGIPTDCPHREKNGWTGDASLAAETGLLNYAAAPAYVKWLQDFADVQRPSGQLPGIVPTGGWGFNWGSGPAWDSAYTHIPWYLYLYCGDRGILETHYAGMKRYLEFMRRMATGHILEFGLGDWCPPGVSPDAPPCPTAVTSTGYYYANCRILARVAAILGHREDAEAYAALAEEVKSAFNARFLNAATGDVTSGSQTALACALFQDLVPAAQVPQVLRALLAAIHLKENHPDFGILGHKYVLNVLSDHGRTDVAYAMATQTTYPSWGHWVEQGATTLWEQWEGTSSRNHIMFGDISAWMYKSLAGLKPDPERPGFSHVIVEPHPVPGLSWAKAEHVSLYGLVRCAWEQHPGRFELDLDLPPNTAATVHLPVAESATVREGDLPVAQAPGVQLLPAEPGQVVLGVGSGDYCFSVSG